MVTSHAVMRTPRFFLLLLLLPCAAKYQIQVPDFMDCTGPWHSDWQLFRDLFREASEEGNGTKFPGFRQDLFGEAYRLYKRLGGEFFEGGG
eukprot:s4007_g5.t1